MCNNEYDYDDSFNYIETDLVTDLFYRIIDLFKDSNNYKEVNEEELEMTLMESNGEICVLQGDWNFYSLGVSYDTALLETVVERLNLDPWYSAEQDLESSMTFVRMHSGYIMQEELIDLFLDEEEANELGIEM